MYKTLSGSLHKTAPIILWATEQNAESERARSKSSLQERVAAIRGRVDCTKHVLDCPGLDVNAKSISRNTAIVLANEREVVKAANAGYEMTGRTVFEQFLSRLVFVIVHVHFDPPTPPDYDVTENMAIFATGIRHSC